MRGRVCGSAPVILGLDPRMIPRVIRNIEAWEGDRLCLKTPNQ
jgi:hypothetical protein